MSFSVQYGYGPKNIDEAIATLREHPKPRPHEFIQSVSTPQAQEVIHVHSAQAVDLLATAQPLPPPPPPSPSAVAGVVDSTRVTSRTMPGLGATTLLRPAQTQRLQQTIRSQNQRANRPRAQTAGLSATGSLASTTEGAGTALSTSGAAGLVSAGLLQKKLAQSAALKQQQEEIQAQLQEFQTKIRAREEARARREEESFAQSLAELNAENRFVAQIERFLDVREEAAARRREALHHDWERNVFNTIQRQIRSELEKMPVAEIERRRRREFQAYLDSTRNTLSPPSLNSTSDVVNQRMLSRSRSGRTGHTMVTGSALGSRLGRFNDPTFSELEEMRKERHLFSTLDLSASQSPAAIGSSQPAVTTLNAGQIDPDLARPRPSLDPREWALARDGPHGRYSEQVVNPKQLLAQDRKYGAGAGPRPRAYICEPASREVPLLSRSHVTFDHFSREIPESVLAAEREKPRGKASVAGSKSQTNSTIFSPVTQEELERTRKERVERFAKSHRRLESYESTKRVTNHDLAYEAPAPLAIPYVFQNILATE